MDVLEKMTTLQAEAKKVVEKNIEMWAALAKDIQESARLARNK